MQRRFTRHLIPALAAMMWLTTLRAALAQLGLHHVHGLAFTPDGKALMVPAHVGLAVYGDGRWTSAPGAPHDFMGFSVAKGAIYTSGHPAPNSPLKNPLGLMKSTDGGKSWQQLGLAGEADFHVMAASYGSSAIYVVNAEPNSRMRDRGLHVTLDDGQSWKSVGAGRWSQIIGLAAHPTDSATVAAGTLTGLHVSRDYAATFKRIGPQAPVTAVTFALDGTHLYFATDAADRLYRLGLDGAGAARCRCLASIGATSFSTSHRTHATKKSSRSRRGSAMCIFRATAAKRGSRSRALARRRRPLRATIVRRRSTKSAATEARLGRER